MRLHQRCVFFDLPAPENVGEAVGDGGNGLFLSIAGHYPMVNEVKAPQVVDAIDVVGVRMGEENCIHPGDAFAKGLLAQVGGGVDNDEAPVVLNHDGGTGSLVPRVCGAADLAAAADHRDTGGCAASQDNQFHGRSPAVMADT